MDNEEKAREFAKQQREITALIEAINAIVQINIPYKQKAQFILTECDEGDRTNLSEFVSWFDDLLD